MNNRQWTATRSPAEGWPTEGDFAFSTSSLPDPGKNQLLTRTIYLSMDPYQWVRRRTGADPVGDVCHGRTVSQVIKSRVDGYQEGDLIFNTNGWQDYGLTGENISVFDYMFPRKLDPNIAPISTAIGVLGMLGLTAYAGVYLQCQPQAGKTVVVSAASGGVGQNAGQIAKLKGCRVIGITGSEEKCKFVTETLGFDAAVNHKDEDLAEQLAAACPDGIDIYFENVGGKVFDAVKPLLNKKSRISLCGLISLYGSDDLGPMLASVHEQWKTAGAAIFAKQEVTVHSLAVGNFVKDYEAQFLSEMGAWVKDGLIKSREDVWQGLENAPAAFSAMLSGGNFGKTMIQVSDDPTVNQAVKQQRGGDNILIKI
ncbi:MAG: NADP-dependent oxidoreductase [Porticoccaceae bacterium]|nr:NADP-dependent oxidoreductase [Porticoccaceae bacterium]